jgi:hypothetical protein
MNIEKITESVSNVFTTNSNYYINKINNLTNYVKSTSIGQTFCCNFKLIYLKHMLKLNDKSNIDKIIGLYHLVSNKNIIYLADIDSLRFFANNILHQFFYTIISISESYGSFNVNFINSHNQISTINVDIKSNIDRNKPTKYYITENGYFVEKNSIKIINNQIDSSYYATIDTYSYDKFYEICYDIPFFLNIKNISYDLNYDLIKNKSSISSNETLGTIIKLDIGIVN